MGAHLSKGVPGDEADAPIQALFHHIRFAVGRGAEGVGCSSGYIRVVGRKTAV